MKMMTSYLVTPFLALFLQAFIVRALTPHGFSLLSSSSSNSSKYLTKEVHWFSQKLDHYNPTDHRVFNQRYYEYLDDFRSPDGPIFLRICGESICPGISNDYMAVLAKKFGAAIVSLEHRYYGESSPFKKSTTSNLEYLSSKQALFDLAAFRNYYQKIVNDRANVSNKENLWFVFGISYSGALSAWFRLKFPHLTCGSLASSAVVLAVYNFTDFDRQVGDSAGPECKMALQEVTKLVDEGLSTNAKAVKALFHAEKLKDDGDFLYLLADAGAQAFQYGFPDALCSPLLEAKSSGADLLNAYAEYVKAVFLGQFGVQLEAYDQESLTNTTVDAYSSTHVSRLWWYQVCTEVAYFQTAPANDSVRSSKVNERYHLDLCKKLFGETVYPEVDVTNLYYGGNRLKGSKIVFTNGSQDPWRWATKQESSKTMPSFLISCHNCGHGTDLRGCPQSPLSPEGDASKCASQDAVHKVREQIVQKIDLWLSECEDQDGKVFLA